MPSFPTVDRRFWFFGGKGGVGKTTCAAAAALAQAGDVLALSLDPAHSLSDVLDRAENVEVLELNAHDEFAHFMKEHRQELRTVADRGTYFDEEDIQGFLDLSLPGLDEIMALLKLGELARESGGHRVIVDLPPTGHALRLFDVSAAFDQLVAALELMQDKHRFAVASLTRRYAPDAIDSFLDELQASCDAAKRALGELSAFILVTRPEPMVLVETVRYAQRVPPAALIVNMVTGEPDLPPELAKLPRLLVPPLPRPPIGESGLQPVVQALAPLLGRRRTGSPHIAASAAAEAGHQLGSIAPLLADPRRLMIFGGKGGVGKTTIAAATALALSRNRNVVALSIDPAHSLGDSFGQQLGDDARPVTANLLAIELDPAKHWQQFQQHWQEEGAQLFGGGRFDAVYDRQIAEQLGKIQPTGLDELQAALCVIDLLDEDPQRYVVVDSAPTGHLLRFLESPDLVVNWAKELMHLLLKYGLAAKVKRVSEDLLDLSRKTKRLDALLHDPEMCEVVVVALDEPPVIAETERLLASLRKQRIAVRRLVLNEAGRLGSAFRDTGLQVIPIGRRPRPIQGLDALEELAA